MSMFPVINAYIMGQGDNDQFDEPYYFYNQVVNYIEERKSRESEKRAENIQILVSLGIIGLAGTLYSQGVVDFPLIRGFASSEPVRGMFRVFIYSTGLFIILKTLTGSIYPMTDSETIQYIHNRVEPFLYLLSLIGLGLLITTSEVLFPLLQSVTESPDVIYTILIMGSSALLAYLLTRRTAVYFHSHIEDIRDRVRKSVVSKTYMEREEDGIEIGILTNAVYSQSGYRRDLSPSMINKEIQRMIQDEDVPIVSENGKVKITNEEDVSAYLGSFEDQN